MIKNNLIVLLMFVSITIGAQNDNLPASFLEEINAEVGLWLADNSEYESKEEPYDFYGMEWTWGINEKSITGRLYGLKDGEDIGTFWEFRKYWDIAKGEAILIQFGGDGTLGIGPFLATENEKEIKLRQTFTRPDGSQFKMGHKTLIIDSTKHTGSSFLINEKNEWQTSRSYTWEKQNDKEEKKQAKVDLEQLDFLVGKWKAVSKDSSFSSILEYQYSPKKRLLKATNNLFGKNGQLFAEYEGAYLLEADKLFYFIAGPKGETHKGYAHVEDMTLVHQAHIYPGKTVKSYKSEMVLKGDRLYYYANYSKELEFPVSVDYSNPLIYKKVEME